MRLINYINQEIRTSPTESMLVIFLKILFTPEFNAVYLIRRAQLTRCSQYRRLLRRKLALRYGIYIGENTQIGIGLTVSHPNSIVIGNGVIVGNNATIYQQTTIGVRSIDCTGNDFYPIIGDNVVIYAGAKIIGNISIGNDCVIGANAVVTKSAPDQSVLKGVPAQWTKIKQSLS